MWSCILVCDWTVLGAHQWLGSCWAVLHSIRAAPISLCAPCTTTPLPSSKQAGGERSWEGAQTGKLSQADLGCTIPHNVIKLKKKGGWSSKVAIAQRLAGHRSARGEWWVIAFASLGFFSFLHSLNCLHLDVGVFSLLLFLCFPCPTGSWVGTELLTGSTRCKHEGELTTLRETGSPNQHGVRLDYG